jgi:hypothetical protein
VLETTLTVLLIVSVVGGGAGIGLWWRAAHTAEVRRALVGLREFLLEAVASGGLDSPRFLEPVTKRRELELSDLTGRVND